MSGVKLVSEALYIPEPNSGCYIWLGRVSGRGYGSYLNTAAHKAMYEQEVGPVPEGMVMDHLCRNRLCVNPEHLEPVTNKDNILRGVGFGAKNYAKTHCVNGHPLNEHNTRLQNRGNGIRRACKTCQRESMRRYRDKKALSQGGGE